jgi:uncharacterized membrane protein YdjX (TVP38/TMEM64 family)
MLLQLSGKQLMIPVVLFIILAAIFSVLTEPALIGNLHEYLQYRVDPFLFLLLMLILPILGVPFSAFLVLVGMKFGLPRGLFFTALLMLIHMAITYFLVHSFLRNWILKLLKKLNLPDSFERKIASRWHLFFFMLVPGLPYAIKNFLLALSGLPLGPYLMINWLAQFGLSVPFIITGTAIIELNPVIISSAVLLLIMVLLIQSYAKRKYRTVKANQANGK